ncbi:MAG TPA: M23 family metallopeptidase [Oligoflexia bacterium]|nr:M23 family metallopeptidase [Oligoflexia bacterium]
MLIKNYFFALPWFLALSFNELHAEEIPLPIKVGVVTSEFGNRPHPIFKHSRFHHGIDIVSSGNSIVKSIGSGLVIYAGTYGGYGNLLVIHHGNSISTHYAHLEKIIVVPGEVVSKGAEIGIIGNTGISKNPHLHFEIRKGGTALDPRKVIPAINTLVKGK